MSQEELNGTVAGVNAVVTPVTNLINRCATAVIEELDNEKEIPQKDLAPFKGAFQMYKAMATVIQKIATNPVVIEAVMTAMAEIQIALDEAEAIANPKTEE